MRYLQPHVLKDLQKKMVFIGGPRQCGKTTLAQSLAQTYINNRQSSVYFNWDFLDDQMSILKRRWKEDDKLLIFDEIHKYPKWKNWIKGLYDIYKTQHQILVTGSARLDVYRRGGDSLLGRYHYFRLHPFTLSEFPAPIKPQEAFKRLMLVGGFPEPFLDGNETEARRWRRERFERILRDDIRDLESVRDIQTLGLFVELLRTRVSGLVVLSNLANDLQVSPKTTKHWLSVLERMYLVFCVKPYTQNLPRAILKPPKVYFYDNADVIGDDGARFENLVATSLLKRIQYLEDCDGYRYELSYIRDKEGREVDFVITKEGCIEELIEVKFGDADVSSSLIYYADKLKPKKAIQIVATLKRGYKQGQFYLETPFDSLTCLS